MTTQPSKKRAHEDLEEVDNLKQLCLTEPGGYNTVYTVSPNGHAHDIEQMRDKDGKLCMECEWKDGKRHGTEKRWYANGNLRMQFEWLNGEQHGIEQRRDEDNNLRTQREYAFGDRHGFEKHWDETGKLVELRKWVKGVYTPPARF